MRPAERMPLPPCGGQLLAGNQYTIKVSFTPTTTGRGFDVKLLTACCGHAQSAHGSGPIGHFPSNASRAGFT
jgi:hypothetical protein